MADDPSVFPGDGEPPTGPAAGRSDGRWLNRETAERLLTGEAVDNAVAPAHRAEADRLARTLGALAAMSAAAPVPDDEELPGEAAALAAFRKAHADRADRAAGGRPGLGPGPAFSSRPVPPADDAGVVRIGGRTPSYGRRRPRWSRPARLGLAAALTVGMVGGVAVAAGTGLLPTPFEDAEPGPAASVSAAATPGPDRPLVSPPPEATPDGGASPATPGGGDSRTTPAPGVPGSAGDLTEACRAAGAGRTLGAERRRTLERAAGGSARVPAYCVGLLGDRDRGSQDSTGSGGGKGGTGSKGDQGGRTGGAAGQDGKGRGGDRADEGDQGDKGDRGGKDAGKPGDKGAKSSGGGNGGGHGDGKGDGKGRGNGADAR
ncbi:hypothetical protein ABZ092_16645 [Streptomyces bobili]|uniref:hypothetical protein n=1 Tax=Streptomyces bobili TaxID=67280 RepID=UPI0033AD87CA